MTEAMIVEAVRAAQSSTAIDPTMAGGVNAPSAVADPSAVSKFQAAMGVNGVDAPAAADHIPFASDVSAVWRSAQANNNGMLHRIRALSQLADMHGPSVSELIELQYEVMNIAFQQDVVTKVADKSSSAIQTLIKNQ